MAQNEIRLSQLDDASATNGQVMTFDGVEWTPADPSGGGPSNAAPISAASAGGAVTLDATNQLNFFMTLTEDVTNFTISGTTKGDSGMIEIKQDATGGWLLGNNNGYTVDTGDLVDVSNVTPTTGIITVGYYHGEYGIVLYVGEGK